MRTHWGIVAVNCAHCGDVHRFLLIERHAREGVQCGHCHRIALPAWRAAEMIRSAREKEEVCRD